MHPRVVIVQQQPAPSSWVAIVAHRLHRRFRTAGAEQLEEVALELWQDEQLRTLEPERAAEAWLAPIVER